MTEFFITDNSSSSRSEIENGIRKVLEMCHKYSISSVILQLPTKSQIQQFQQVFHQSQIRSLEKDNRTTAGGITFNVHTSRKPISSWTENVILSYLPQKRNLDELVNLKQAKAIIIIPWMDKERKLAIKMFDPEIISGDATSISSDALDPRLESGLDTLTSRINISTGLRHSSDRESAIQLLKFLNNHGVKLESEEIKVWAVNNGWDSDGANELMDIANKINQNRRFRTSGVNMWSQDFLNSLIGK